MRSWACSFALAETCKRSVYPLRWTFERPSACCLRGRRSTSQRQQSFCSINRPSSRTQRVRGPGAHHLLGGQSSVRRDATGQHREGRDVRRQGTGLAVPFPVRRTGRSDGPAGWHAVFETYPVLTMISLGWTLPDPRPAGRLPKYNPERKKTFSRLDWKYVCDRTLGAFSNRGLIELEQWIDDAARIESPRKRDQDHLDACLCLLVAVHLAEGKSCLMVGDLQSGYIVVPDGARLRTELESRCAVTRRRPSEWVRVFQRSAKVVPS